MKSFPDKFLCMLLFVIYLGINNLFAHNICLNGNWEVGEDRNYTKTIDIPGLVSEPDQMNKKTIWLKRDIQLPGGEWTHATLFLKGALFSPSVYINGDRVSMQNGGMAPTIHSLNHEAIKPDNPITIEIALKSLKDIPESDASYVAVANHWRSNISSLIWDDIILQTHGEFYISRIIPFNDIQNDRVNVHFEIENRSRNDKIPEEIICEIIDQEENIIASSQKALNSLSEIIPVPLKGNCQWWSPETPNLYNLKITLIDRQRVIDTRTISFGKKEFGVEGHQFRLNGNPYKVRAGTVVWHRWIRDPEAKYIAFNKSWFKQNVVQRLKDHGANTLRFHLGNPPEAFLDMCDKYGLLVQYEWSFFHGMPASEESLLEQWKSWLDLAMRHPSVSLIHPFNETSGDELDVVWSALDKLVKEYPPMVLEERDVTHVHKYWWSMFENVGLYYDSAEEFPKPVMVDEFGGNYLDGYANLGGYKTLKESFLRFCGRGHTPEMRLYHHTIANSQIAEYWRRIGAAGFSPFCIAGSREDGSHWYLGRLKSGIPKDVWQALTAAYSPISVSLEIWDRNFVPGQEVKIPVHFFNDTRNISTLNVDLFIEDERGKRFAEKRIKKNVEPFQKVIQDISFTLPLQAGRYTYKAVLQNPPPMVKYPVISQWDFRIITTIVPDRLEKRTIGIIKEEVELKEFLSSFGLSVADIDDEEPDIILGSKKTWEKLVNSVQMKEEMYHYIQSGRSIVLLDVGPQYFGQGYSKDPAFRYGFIQGRSVVKDPDVQKLDLFGGIKLNFKTIAEPESHIHPSKYESDLWFNLERDYTWLWNGMRGGIIAPAIEMGFSGLSAAAVVSMWKSRGADGEMFKGKSYYAYDLQGFYAYSENNNDEQVVATLRKKVNFLIEDAPSLAISINPDAEIEITDLINLYKNNRDGGAEKLIPLVNCGINLFRSPLILVDFGRNQGSVIISQLVTEGRLSRRNKGTDLYSKRYDPVAVQLVLNMLNEVVNK